MKGSTYVLKQLFFLAKSHCFLCDSQCFVVFQWKHLNFVFYYCLTFGIWKLFSHFIGNKKKVFLANREVSPALVLRIHTSMKTKQFNHNIMETKVITSSA